MAGKVTARARAREATAAMLAKRREHEKQIESSVRDFITATDAVEFARQHLTDAEHDRLRALAALVDLGMSNTEIREVCGVDRADLRAARQHLKEHAADQADDSAGDESTTTDPGRQDDKQSQLEPTT